MYHRRNIKVLARSSQSVAFLIRPKKIGQITIKAMANSPFISDTLETSLLVEPEGTTIYHNKGFLIDLRSITEQKINFTLQIPKNFIPESLNIEVSVVGDILGPVIKNLDQLVRIPLGCGEQNMVNFVPNILILEYLEVKKFKKIILILVLRVSIFFTIFTSTNSFNLLFSRKFLLKNFSLQNNQPFFTNNTIRIF